MKSRGVKEHLEKKGIFIMKLLKIGIETIYSICDLFNIIGCKNFLFFNNFIFYVHFLILNRMYK